MSRYHRDTKQKQTRWRMLPSTLQPFKVLRRETTRQQAGSFRALPRAQRSGRCELAKGRLNELPSLRDVG